MKEYRLVPVNPKTGKLVKRPRRGQPVKYAVLGPRGGLKPLSRAPVQRYYKTDYQGLNRMISGKKDFIVYEELTRKKDPQTGKFLTKLTYLKPDKKQRPSLYSGSKRRRALGIGFQKHSRAKQADQKNMIMVEPSKTPPLVLHVEGPTIRQALSDLMVLVDKKDIYDKKGRTVAGLYYNIIIRLTLPTGKVIRIPASGSLAVLRKFKAAFPEMRTQIYRAVDKAGKVKREVALRKSVGTLANLHNELSHAITQSLQRVGYRFTRTKDLKKYAAQMSREIKRLDRDARKYEKAGNEDMAERKRRSIEKVSRARKRLLTDLPKKKLIERGKYSLDIQIEFERVPVK